MIERVVETQRVVTEGGVSETTLADRLNQLENKLRVLIFSQSSQQSAQTSAVSHAVALSQRIDNLSNTTITNPTITGGSITGSSIVGTISSAISTALATIDDLTTTELVAVNATFTSATSTTFYAGALGAGTASITNATTTNLATENLRVSSLDCTGYANGGTLTTDASGNVVCATDDGGAGSSVAGSDTQVQFNSGGGFAAAASFTFASSSGKLAVPYASTTALTATTLYATTASTTNLTVSSSQTNSLTVNGFATSTFNGGINIATGCFSVNGTCITSGSGAADGTFSTTSADWRKLQSNFFSTTSVNAWEATQWRWSTSSALGFEATQWRWSTTSSDYWLTQQNVSAFSTTSADYWDTTKFRWATTSSDYWKSVNSFFSTTREATQWRWATTSTNYFESTQWRWATSSSNNAVNVFINGSTTIPKTFTANAFTALQTFGAAASTSALTISNIQNGILSTNATGGVVATTSIGFNYLAGTLGVGQGGTGSTTLGGILKGNGTGIIQSAIAGTDYLTGSGVANNCVKWGANNTLTDALSPCGSGGGSGGGTWATTTAYTGGPLINYSLNSTDIITIGAAATSSAKFIFDPNTGIGYINGSLGIGTTTPGAKLAIAGDVLASRYVATSSLASIFPYASSTAFTATSLFSTTASTTNLTVSSSTQTNSLTVNGFSTSTFNGGINLATGCFSVNGTCITSGSAADGTFSTTSADYWESAQWRWATTSSDYWLSQYSKGFFFSTTSADFWKSANNFFSTSSVNYWESTLWRWSTTSNDYWETTQTRWATTSSNYWLSQNQGAAFSTTSANAFLGSKTTDNLSEGATNKYYTDYRVASVIAGTTTSALAEGANKYYTDQRADARINATSSIGTLTSAPNLGTLATTLSGFLKATAGVLSTALINLASDITGILPVGNGGTGWANIAASAIPYGSGAGALATTTAGTGGYVLAYLNGVPAWTATTTFGAPLSYSSGAVSISAANGSTNGYLSSGDWNAFNTKFATSSSDFWIAQYGKGFFFSTTSADYWDGTKWRWGTTSSDYWSTQRNFFSTTSADAWDATKSRWATTSQNAWESTQWRWATTSADYHLSQNQGAAFSTTSANYLLNASTTIPRTTLANSWSPLQSFTTGFLSNASSTIVSGLFSMNGGASTTDFTATGNTVLGNATTTALFAATASTTNYFGAGLTLCQSGNVLTWASGRFGCAADQTGGAGSAWPFTPSTNYGVAVQSTSTPIWATTGLMASSTSYFVNASSTALTVSGTAFFGTATSTTLNSNSATIGSLTAGSLSLGSLGTFAGGFLSQASSTVVGLLTTLNSSSSLATLGTLWFPNITNGLLSTDSTGKLVATSTPTAASFVATSTTASQFPYASSTALTVSGVGYFGVGAFTSTTGTTTVASGQGLTVGGSQFVVQQGSGNLGIGTASPGYALDVNGDVNVASGKCFRVNGVCIGYVTKLAAIYATSTVGTTTVAFGNGGPRILKRDSNASRKHDADDDGSVGWRWRWRCGFDGNRCRADEQWEFWRQFLLRHELHRMFVAIITGNRWLWRLWSLQCGERAWRQRRGRQQW